MANLTGRHIDRRSRHLMTNSCNYPSVDTDYHSQQYMRMVAGYGRDPVIAPMLYWKIVDISYVYLSYSIEPFKRSVSGVKPDIIVPAIKIGDLIRKALNRPTPTYTRTDIEYRADKIIVTVKFEEGWPVKREIKKKFIAYPLCTSLL